MVVVVAAAIGFHALAPPGARKEPSAGANPGPAAPVFVAADLPPFLVFASESLEKSARHRAYLAADIGDRMDVLTIGDPAAEGALIRLVAATKIASRADPGLFVIAAKQAAELESSILRMEAPRTWRGARGNVEWAEMTLSTPREARDCLALRVLGSEAVGLSGIVCPNAAAAADEATLACVVGELAATQEGTRAGLPEIPSDRPSGAPPCRGLSG